MAVEDVKLKAQASKLRIPVVGLIGGIGSGKSLVAGYLAELGARVIDADKIGHEALRQPEVREQAIHRWGPAILTEEGNIDRRKLGRIVFADASERRALEAMVHPWIGRRIHEQLTHAQHDPQARFVVLDAAILLETGWDRVCDYVIYVDSPRAERLQRLQAQRGWNEKEVTAREGSQLPLEEKRGRADAIVDNSGDPAQTRRQVEQLVKKLL